MEWNTADILTIYRIGVEIGLIDAKSIIGWADSRIAHSDLDKLNQEDYLFDLSLSGKKGSNEILRILKSHESDPDYELVWQILYGLVKYQLNNENIDLSKACYAISAIAIHINNETEYDLSGMSLDDAYHLMSEGVTGSAESILEQLNEYTTPCFSLGKAFFEQELSNKNEA